MDKLYTVEISEGNDRDGWTDWEPYNEDWTGISLEEAERNVAEEIEWDEANLTRGGVHYVYRVVPVD